MEGTKNHKKLAVFDIDGTFYRWQLYYDIILKLVERGFFPKNEADEIMTRFYAWQSRSEPFSAFEHIAIETLEIHLAELTHDLVQEVSAEIIAESGHKVYSYTRSLAASLKEQGYFLLAISGSLHEIAEPFAKRYGFDECIGWIYEQKDGKYTGKSLRKTAGHKAERLQEFITSHDMSLEGSVGIGDSGGDIDMLEMVAHPIAFNPSEELLAAAKENGWAIAVERKNIIYEMSFQNGIYLLEEARPL